MFRHFEIQNLNTFKAMRIRCRRGASKYNRIYMWCIWKKTKSKITCGRLDTKSVRARRGSERERDYGYWVVNILESSNKQLQNLISFSKYNITWWELFSFWYNYRYTRVPYSNIQLSGKSLTKKNDSTEYCLYTTLHSNYRQNYSKLWIRWNPLFPSQL